MSGFKRLFWALTLLWALFWTIVYPLHDLLTKRVEAYDKYDKMNKDCDAAIVQHPESAALKDCHKWADDNLQTAMNAYSFRNFWVLPVAFWRIFLPLIVIPPAIVYGLGTLGVWVRNGFKSRTNYS